MIHAARSNARRDSVIFDITIDDIEIPLLCPVLGIVLRFEGPPFSEWLPSLDKVRPSLGYVKGNIRVISWRANRLKADCVRPDDLRAVADYIDGIDRYPFNP